MLSLAPATQSPSRSEYPSQRGLHRANQELFTPAPGRGFNVAAPLGQRLSRDPPHIVKLLKIVTDIPIAADVAVPSVLCDQLPHQSLPGFFGNE